MRKSISGLPFFLSLSKSYHKSDFIRNSKLSNFVFPISQEITLALFADDTDHTENTNSTFMYNYDIPIIKSINTGHNDACL